jgi:hypothetical protein
MYKRNRTPEDLFIIIPFGDVNTVKNVKGNYNNFSGTVLPVPCNLNNVFAEEQFMLPPPADKNPIFNGSMLTPLKKSKFITEEYRTPAESSVKSGVYYKDPFDYNVSNISSSMFLELSNISICNETHLNDTIIDIYDENNNIYVDNNSHETDIIVENKNDIHFVDVDTTLVD